jgi:hypothetical protein
VDDLKQSHIDNQGWIYARLDGPAYERGMQHGKRLGYLIPDAIDRVKLWASHAIGRDWNYFRKVAKELYQPKITGECNEELKGIVAGAKDAGVVLDYVDLVALNGYEDSINYHYFLRKQGNSQSQAVHVGGCSAFVANGSQTRDGQVVMGHTTWWPYLLGKGWNLLLHVKPTRGNEVLMQSMPGFIFSGSDWYMNSAGLIVCETTITGVYTFRPEGTPTFVRAREAMQYCSDIDSWRSTMLKDNNGGLANSWLIGDTNRNEIALLELGTYNHELQRTKDGCYVGCNLAFSEGVRTETEFNYSDGRSSPKARYERWMQLLSSRRKIDFETAKSYLSDHRDVSLGQDNPSHCSLCGHVETDERGAPELEWGAFYPGGSFDAKITTASLAKDGRMWARWGKPCGASFDSKSFLKGHPEYSWQEPLLAEIKAHDWTLIDARFGVKN